MLKKRFATFTTKIKQNETLAFLLLAVGLIAALVLLGWFIFFLDLSTPVDFVYNQF